MNFNSQCPSLGLPQINEAALRPLTCSRLLAPSQFSMHNGNHVKSILTDPTVILSIHLLVLEEVLFVWKEFLEAGAVVLDVVQQSLSLHFPVYLVFLGRELTFSKDKWVVCTVGFCALPNLSSTPLPFCRVINCSSAILVDLLFQVDNEHPFLKIRLSKLLGKISEGDFSSVQRAEYCHTLLKT